MVRSLDRAESGSRSYRRGFGLVSTLCLLVLTTSPLDAQTVYPRFPVTDGEVNALAISGRVLYVGGAFSVIGSPTGAGVPVDSATAGISPFPEVRGVVHAAVDDGAGGWFIGGAFDRVGDAPRANLARVRSDGGVDSWDPPTDGPVYALARDGDAIYAGGAFTTVAGATHPHLVALDASGATLPRSTDADNIVRALLIDQGVLYVAGDFTGIGGQARSRLAALDGTGQVLPWTCDADRPVHCLAAADGLLYVGGEFLEIGGQWRHRIAATDLVTGAVTPWNGTANGTVRAIAVNRGKVYAAGYFSIIGGRARNCIAALSTRWWQALDWYPDPDGTVTSVYTIGNRVYIGGNFTRLGGVMRGRAALLDTLSGQVAEWSPPVNGPVNVLAPSGTRIYVGGAFTSVGGKLRRGVAAIDRISEQVTDWDAHVQGVVLAIAPHRDRVYLGGFFSRVGGEERSRAAAVDSSSASVLPWKLPEAWGSFNSIAATDSLVYLGSLYYPAPDHLMAVDAMTGTRAWGRFCGTNPNGIRALAYVNDRLFLAGRDSASYSGLLAFDPTTGQVLSSHPFWQAYPRYLFCTAQSPGRLWVGGDSGLYGVDPLTADYVESGPQIDQWGGLKTLAVAGDHIYAGGTFSDLGGQPRSRLGSIHVTTLAVTDWNPGTNSSVEALAAADGVVYAGGRFTEIGGASHWYLGAIDDAQQLLDVGSPSLESEPSVHFVAMPNPLESSTTVQFRLPGPARTSLEVFDVTGRIVRSVLRDRALPSGDHHIALDRRDLPAGVYWLRLLVNGRATSGKIVVAN